MAYDKNADFEAFEKRLQRQSEIRAGMANVHVDAAQQGPNVPEGLIASASGATSSHAAPFSFYPTYEGQKLTSLRFEHGNAKHEKNDPVYLNANWLKAFHARDVAFFRERAKHCMEHFIDEMRGKDDMDPGGNLGAMGWFQDVMAYVKVNDPFFYGAIQGKWNITDTSMEKTLDLRGK